MSGLQEIEVVIHPDGRVQVEVKGVKGKGCRDMTQELERYLGGRVLERRPTGEYQENQERDERPARNGVGRR